MMLHELNELTFTGRVIKKEITKGLRNIVANVFNTECGKELILRQQNKSALDDSELDSLNGKIIKAKGSIQSYVFVLSSFEIQE